MIQVTAIPAFRDNYIWALQDPDTGDTAVVDPGDAGPVLDWLHQHGARLSGILITHHHPDHVGGVRALLRRFDVPIYGPAYEDIPGLSVELREGDELTLHRPRLTFQVLDIPGHTAGHIAYYGDGRLFCGDTLFAGGCGRLFEGTPEQMHASLSKLAALPPETLVYCAHEYTEANLRFAARVEPSNQALQQRLERTLASRDKGDITLPSRLREEMETNPFLRASQPAVKKSAEEYSGRTLSSPVEVFAAVRAWKDSA